MLQKEQSFLLTNSWFLLPFGVLVAIRVLVSLIGSLIYFWNTHIKIRFEPCINLRTKYGQWAVVTGCTSGIGEHFVHELASKGMDIILVSRSLDKLQKQAQETEKLYGVQTKVIATNYLERDACKIVGRETQGMDIGIVVNNVGLNTDTGSRLYHEMSVKDVRDMIVVNCGACTIMTKYFLPQMVSKRRGCILNIGSTSGFVALPSQTLYCATKGYMRIWSRAASIEIKESGSAVRCSMPQFVKTGMCKGNNIIYNIPFYTCHPRVYTKNAILTLDTPDMGGWWMFDLVLWLIRVLFYGAICPREWLTPILYKITRFIAYMGSNVEE